MLKKGQMLLLVLCCLGCASGQMPYAASGQEVRWEQDNVSLFRKKPHIWPAKGKVILTDEELQFIPTPYYWIFNVHGRDTTTVRLSDIAALQKEQWLLVYPFGLEVITSDGKHYPFVTWRRSKLAQAIEQLKE